MGGIFNNDYSLGTETPGPADDVAAYKAELARVLEEKQANLVDLSTPSTSLVYRLPGVSPLFPVYKQFSFWAWLLGSSAVAFFAYNYWQKR